MDRTQRDARVAEIAALDQPVRSSLYALLVEQGEWMSREDAARAVGVPRSVAAFHLDKLADAGVVDVRFERPPGRRGPGAGRPAKQYRRSHKEVALSLPERRYDLAGALFADAVADAASTRRPVEVALAEAAREAGRQMAATIRDERSTPPEVPACSVAARALERLGYEPHVVDGEVLLANCPFHALADRHRQLVCGMNLELLTGLADGLGVSPRLAPRLEPEDGMCCVRLKES